MTSRPTRLTVRMTGDLAADLDVVMRGGGTAADAVRTAVALLADAYRSAWDHGDVPDGMPPRIIGVRYAAHDGTPAPVPPAPGMREVPVHTRYTGATRHDA